MSVAIKFVQDRVLTHGETFGAAVGFSFLDSHGHIKAGVVFHNYSPSSGVVEMSAASDDKRWLNRQNLNVLFDYAFETANCRIVVARHSASNSTAIKLWDRLGANQYTLPELRAPGEDEVLATLSNEAWQNGNFIKKR